MLTIPLIGYEDSLVGVLQILNKHNGIFDEQDEFVASALAAQAAVVLHRVKLTEACRMDTANIPATVYT